jgi:hypothetical protein
MNRLAGDATRTSIATVLRSADTEITWPGVSQ